MRRHAPATGHQEIWRQLIITPDYFEKNNQLLK
jgi:hypothetical protein